MRFSVNLHLELPMRIKKQRFKISRWKIINIFSIC